MKEIARRENLDNGCELITYTDGSKLLACESKEAVEELQAFIEEQIEEMSEPEREILRKRFAVDQKR